MLQNHLGQLDRLSEIETKEKGKERKGEEWGFVESGVREALWSRFSKYFHRVSGMSVGGEREQSNSATTQ